MKPRILVSRANFPEVLESLRGDFELLNPDAWEERRS